MSEHTLDAALPKQLMTIYEVFRQEEPGGPMIHAGQVQAPTPELAPQYAREGYGRRGESVRLWVVPRIHVLELADLDILQPVFDRSYKSGKGYREAVDKRRDIRARLGTLAESSAVSIEISTASSPPQNTPSKTPIELRSVEELEHDSGDSHA